MQFKFYESFLPTYIPLTIVELCLQEHISYEDIFSNLDLSLDDLRNKYFKLTYAELNTLTLNCITALSSDELSIKVGKYIQLHHLGIIGKLLEYSPTLADALHILERYSLLIDPTIWFKVEQQDQLIIIHYRKMIPLGDTYQFNQYSQEVLSILIIRLLTNLYDIKGLQLEFEFPTPVYSRKLNFLRCSIDWNKPETRLIIPLINLEKKSLINKKESEFYQLIKQAEYDFKVFNSIKKNWIFQVLGLIYSHINKPLNTKDFVKLLYISRSTFFRKLQEHETNYEDLIQYVRMDFASKYLIQNRGSISSLAYYLGFSHPSNFIKSFKQCFGMTPKQWQNKHNETI